MGIIGSNYVGKSTILKILSRVTAPTSGEINVKGKIAILVGFEETVVLNTSKPYGQPHSALDVSRGERTFSFCSRMNFKDGLRRMIEWYSLRTALG